MYIIYNVCCIYCTNIKKLNIGLENILSGCKYLWVVIDNKLKLILQLADSDIVHEYVVSVRKPPLNHATTPRDTPLFIRSVMVERTLNCPSHPLWRQWRHEGCFLTHSCLHFPKLIVVMSRGCGLWPWTTFTNRLLQGYEGSTL